MFNKCLIVCFLITTYLKVYSQIVWYYPPPTFPVTEHCIGKCFEIYDTVIGGAVRDTASFYRHFVIFKRFTDQSLNESNFNDTIQVSMINFRFTYCFTDTGVFSIQNTYTGFNNNGFEITKYYFLGFNAFTIKGCPPVANYYNKKDTICENECLKITDSTERQTMNWQWQFYGSNIPLYNGKAPPEICYNNNGKFFIQLIASNTYGADTLIKEISVAKCNDCIQTPNAFTPNNDGMNDFFKVYSNCFLEEYKIQIYNRWSNLVFESADINNNWNGKYRENECEPDAYSYLITYKNSLKNKVEYKKGSITLLK